MIFIQQQLQQQQKPEHLIRAPVEMIHSPGIFRFGAFVSSKNHSRTITLRHFATNIHIIAQKASHDALSLSLNIESAVKFMIWSVKFRKTTSYKISVYFRNSEEVTDGMRATGAWDVKEITLIWISCLWKLVTDFKICISKLGRALFWWKISICDFIPKNTRKTGRKCQKNLPSKSQLFFSICISFSSIWFFSFLVPLPSSWMYKQIKIIKIDQNKSHAPQSNSYYWVFYVTTFDQNRIFGSYEWIKWPNRHKWRNERWFRLHKSSFNWNWI